MATTDPSSLNIYHRPLVVQHNGESITVWLDSYDLCALTQVNQDGQSRRCSPSDPAIYHAIKKVVWAGDRPRGKTKIQDLTEARNQLNMAIEIEQRLNPSADLAPATG